MQRKKERGWVAQAVLGRPVSRLDGPEFFRWMALRRVRRGGLTRFQDHYYDQGRPVPGFLIPDLVDALIEQELLQLADSNEAGMRRVWLTDAGQAEYRVLVRRQRGKDPQVPPGSCRYPEGCGTPALRRDNRSRWPGQPESSNVPG